MSQISEWFEKRPQFKKPDFWLGILIMLAGGIWFIFNHTDFAKRSLSLAVMMGGMGIMLYARRRK